MANITITELTPIQTSSSNYQLAIFDTNENTTKKGNINNILNTQLDNSVLNTNNKTLPSAINQLKNLIDDTNNTIGTSTIFGSNITSSIGGAELTTSANTLSEAIVEHEEDISNINRSINDINNLIGNADSISGTITGSIVQLNNNINNKVNKSGGQLSLPSLKWGIGTNATNTETTPYVELRNGGPIDERNLTLAYYAPGSTVAEGHPLFNPDGVFIPEKAKTNHASDSSTYGLGTTNYYGHCKVVNNLTTASHTDGLALSAFQGKNIKDNLIRNVVRANRASVTDRSIPANGTLEVKIPINTPSGYSLLGWANVWYDGSNTTGATSTENIITCNQWKDETYIYAIAQNLSSTVKKCTVNTYVYFIRDIT